MGFKTEGNQEDFDRIVKNLREGYSYREAITGFTVRPSEEWLKEIRPLAERIARDGNPPPLGLTNLAKKPLSYITVGEKVFAIYPGNIRKEVVEEKGESAPAGAVAISGTQEPVANFVEETDQPKAAKKSRRKKTEW